jgi:S1 RNA binding domain protein
LAIEVGNVFEGRVTGVKPFGAFVALPEGGTGMVHISEVSNEFVQDIAAVLHIGDTVKVQVINVAPDGKIALSIKRLLPPPPRQPREGRGPAGGARPGAPRPGGPREGGHFGAGRGGNGRPPRVWQPKAPVHSDNMSFEDMMSRFKSQSEEKMADLDHETNNRRGGGYAPRGRGGRR